MQRLYPMYTLHKAFKQRGLTLDFAGVMSTHDKVRAASVLALITSHSRVTIGAVFLSVVDTRQNTCSSCSRLNRKPLSGYNRRSVSQLIQSSIDFPD